MSILIFPEGTRLASNNLEKHKIGIFAVYKEMNIPVILAFVDSGKFWPTNSLKKKPGKITLKFKDVIYPGLQKSQFEEVIKSSRNRYLCGI
jgi:1-acyl-sn-glycerol-3-phosphate acyltransferase